MFQHSVKVWSGESVEVVVRIDPELENVAREWPLVDDQVVESDDKGAVVVRARTSGIVEPLRWVLRWGRAAEALSPPELRRLVQNELEGALAAYRSV